MSKENIVTTYVHDLYDSFLSVNMYICLLRTQPCIQTDDV